MSLRLKWLLFTLMSLALGFGFLHQFFPESHLRFERLHIFLFNLCAGGTIVIYHTEGQRYLTRRGAAFCVVSLCYALCAFFEWYAPAVVCAWFLSGLVESVRWRRFGSFFPKDFFDPNVRVTVKFHQASVLCLSCGLFISGLVILNNKFFHWVNLPALQLRSFFLGFSFPLSLITMSVMFSLIRDQFSHTVKILKNVAFWVVNLGVITFFIFIIFERFGWQFFASSVLTCCVLLIFYLYSRLGIQEQQKNFLTSGMFFLVFTAITGMLYIFEHMTNTYNPERGLFILRLHALVSLYGWNLSGLAVLCRYNDFPIRLHSRKLITLHWLTVVVFAPLGYYSRLAAIIALVCYMFVLHSVFFAKTSHGLYSRGFQHAASS